MNRRHHPERHQRARIQIAHAGPARIADAIPGAGDVRQPAHALGDDVERRPVHVGALPGARIAEAAHRRVDDARVAGGDHLVAAAEAVHDAGTGVLEHGVGLLAHAQKDLAVVGSFRSS
jgi:hypothetical protein